MDPIFNGIMHLVNFIPLMCFIVRDVNRTTGIHAEDKASLITFIVTTCIFLCEVVAHIVFFRCKHFFTNQWT